MSALHIDDAWGTGFADTLSKECPARGVFAKIFPYKDGARAARLDCFARARTSCRPTGPLATQRLLPLNSEPAPPPVAAAGNMEDLEAQVRTISQASHELLLVITISSQEYKVITETALETGLLGPSTQWIFASTQLVSVLSVRLRPPPRPLQRTRGLRFGRRPPFSHRRG